MRTDFLICAMIGMASASSIIPRQDEGYGKDDGYSQSPPPLPMKSYDTGKDKSYDTGKDKSYDTGKDKSYDMDDKDMSYDTDKYTEVAKEKGYSTEPYRQGSGSTWRPKTSHPEFFSLRVDEACDEGEDPTIDCRFDNYAIRLEQGIVIATPYNKWWDPKLPIMFVDDDTELYTVSKKPLQLFIDAVTGALRYAPVGFLPPNSIAFSFYKTGNNPLGDVDPSPAQLSWPSTQGNTLGGVGPWTLCPLGNTRQYQVFVSDGNFGSGIPSGVFKDALECQTRSLAAINASPWRSGASAPY
ncbi:hypothetical protein NX059_009327 [Plenodomus lindquistii]|nr:hypothetical protein NX059_009327 [Plenodomus lindquistii]